ncbi:MAG: helix-turn-helix domain-containing protein [Bacteroidales bacterium]|nr:helix-turn-helix domain-containing protein [Bacteroidales bacterium]
MNIKHNCVEGFGIRLTELIMARKTNCIQISKAIGCDRKSLYKWKNGEANPDILMLCRLCTFLGTTPNYLLYGKE